MVRPSSANVCSSCPITRSLPQAWSLTFSGHSVERRRLPDNVPRTMHPCSIRGSAPAAPALRTLLVGLLTAQLERMVAGSSKLTVILASCARSCRTCAPADPRHRLARHIRHAGRLPHPPSAGDGENRRRAVHVVGGSEGAGHCASRSRSTATTGIPAGRRPSVQDDDGRGADRRPAARRRHDVSPGRHRLRRTSHLGVGRRIPAEQPLDRLSSRSGDDAGDGGVSLSPITSGRSCTTPTRAALHGVSWGSRRFYRWTLAATGASPTRRAAGDAADAEPIALRRLPGLQVRRRPPHAVLGRRPRSRTARTAPPFGWAGSI